MTDVVAHCENKIEIKFPIIGDQDRSISTKYGMIDPGTSDAQSLPLTIRMVFIINPENKLMLNMNYPACVGATWTRSSAASRRSSSRTRSHRDAGQRPNNREDIPMGDERTSELGSVFLLPTVSDAGRANYPHMRRPERVPIAPRLASEVEEGDSAAAPPPTKAETSPQARRPGQSATVGRLLRHRLRP